MTTYFVSATEWTGTPVVAMASSVATTDTILAAQRAVDMGDPRFAKGR